MYREDMSFSITIRRAIRRNLAWVALLMAWPVAVLANCERSDKDWGLVTFGLDLPSPGPVKGGALPTDIVQRYAKGPVRLAPLLAAGDFSGAQAHWDQIAQLAVREQQTRAMTRSLFSLDGRGLMLLDKAQAWLTRHPQSPAAQLTLATAYVEAATEARGGNAIGFTRSIQLDHMRARFQLADPLIEALLPRKDIYGMGARYLLATRGMLGGSSSAGWSALMEVIAYAPHDENLYQIAAGYAHPRWSSGTSPMRLRALLALAHRHRLPEPHMTALKQAFDAIDRPPERIANPQAVRPYWEARVSAAPTLHNLVDWMEAEYRLTNWPLLLDITQRIHVLYPQHRRAWEVRSWALKQMDRPHEAYQAAMAAATVGSDWAMSEVIQSHVRGGMGRPLKDFAGLYAHCQMAGALALPSGANCLGSSHTEGFGGARIDHREALRWHLMAARGGHSNSAHDVAVLLPRIVKDAAQRADVDAAAGYWLQAAARKGHQIASNKLAARPGWGLSCDDRRKANIAPP
ncbi:hypothetical protein H010_00745 [Hydrogenophaga taeniospiralis CCUG 15921]|uniref:Sel1 repeat family protein n=2 Tax=Hydrogenophaga TaxID=47420 RepID=A0A9X4SD68_9BURK|nr:hypothetical protein [Hydrogenophaga taeniospiralis CCUG 15921]